MSKSDYPFVAAAQSDMQSHGEVHAVFDEHDSEIELRNGVTEFDFNNGLISVEGPDHTVKFGMERLVSFYKPVEVFH